MASPNKPTILVADDNGLSLALIKRALEQGGFPVRTATDGQEALGILCEEDIHILVTDWVMPELDGLDLCRRIRGEDSLGFLYIIVVTDTDDRAKMIEAFEAGADDFICKPIVEAELRCRVSAAARIVSLEGRLAKQHRALHKANAELALANEKYERLATIDELTGLPNRREAMSFLADVWSHSVRTAGNLSCVAIDIDHFKRVNDTHGHDVGDEVLRALAANLRKLVRGGERLCRVGGEEFLLICPGATTSDAGKAAERLRSAVEAHPIRARIGTITATISAGVATRRRGDTGVEDMLRRADDALYVAKRGGRNRIALASLVPTLDTGSASRDDGAFSNAGAPTTAPKGTVLVVSDDAGTTAAARRCLEGDGYAVTNAGDRVSALERLSDSPPHLILVASDLPGTDVRAWITKLRESESTANVPILVTTGAPTTDELLRFIDAGADGLIKTPLQQRELLLRTGSILRMYRGASELEESNRVRVEQARTLELLLELSQRLAVAQDLHRTLEYACDTLVELTTARRVSMMLADEEGQELRIAHCVGLDPKLSEEIVIESGEGIAGAVFEQRTPIVVNSADEAPESKGRYDDQIFASVPLTSHALSAGDEILGVVNITDRVDGAPFRSIEIEAIGVVCNMTAAAIHEIGARTALDESRDSVVVALATLAEYRDSDTGMHLERVTRYAIELAKDLRTQLPFSREIDDRFIDDLRRAMPLHDVGKVAIPDSVLLKPGKLTPEERAEMQRHAQIGGETIQSVIERAPAARFLKVAADIARWHHEWIDGTGYPDGLVGDDIPLAARIAAVADVYDALTTRRVYKDAFPHEQAVRMIAELSGRQFDPQIVSAFHRLSPIFEQLSDELRDDVLPGGERAEASRADAEVLAVIR